LAVSIIQRCLTGACSGGREASLTWFLSVPRAAPLMLAVRRYGAGNPQTNRNYAMSDIFISYAREDVARVEPLAKALESEGWSVWWDPLITPGRSFDLIIEEALKSTRCVIVIWSNSSVASAWVLDEAWDGAERRILLPILIEDIKIPLGFRRIQAVNMVNWQGELPHSSFDKLKQALSTMLETSAGTTKASGKQKRDFSVGDIIEQYRYFDGFSFVEGAEKDMLHTRWRVLKITEYYVELQLLQGKYLGMKPGYTCELTSSNTYARRFPGGKATQQIYDEFHKVSL
jgi:TIR domain